MTPAAGGVVGIILAALIISLFVAVGAYLNLRQKFQSQSDDFWRREHTHFPVCIICPECKDVITTCTTAHGIFDRTRIHQSICVMKDAPNNGLRKLRDGHW